MWARTPTPTAYSVLTYTHMNNSPACVENSHLTNGWLGECWPSVLAMPTVFVCVCVSGQAASPGCVCTNSLVWVFKSQQDAFGWPGLQRDGKGVHLEGVLASVSHMFTHFETARGGGVFISFTCTCAETLQARAPAPIQTCSRQTGWHVLLWPRVHCENT